MTCDIRDRNLPCEAAAYQLVPNGLESITRAQTHWLGPTRSAICRSAFELAQRAQRDFRMIRFELASEINDVQAA